MTRQRKQRKAFVPSEKQTITTPDVEDGGKLHPAQMPGGSALLPERERKLPKFPVREVPKPKPRIERKPKGQVVLIEQIKDVDNYKPGKISDEVLRDDFRIVLAWYATHRRSPKTFKHDLETIERLLRAILKEAKRRGPDVIRFDPKGMAPSVRNFFLTIARQVRIPEAQFKRVTLKPDLDVSELTTAELMEAHWNLHLMYRKPEVKGWSTEDIANLHALVVDKLFARHEPHPAPPDDGLDNASEDFESHLDEQPNDWTKIDTHRKVEKKFSTINPSGVERGEEIHLADVLQCFETFKLRKPYIYLVGGLANHGKTKGDIDILVKDSTELPEDLKHIIHFRLGRALPPELAERLEIHYDDFHGPFTNFVELFDLTCERINLENEVKEMREEAHPEEAYLDEREKIYADAEAEVMEEDDDGQISPDEDGGD